MYTKLFLDEKNFPDGKSTNLFYLNRDFFFLILENI